MCQKLTHFSQGFGGESEKRNKEESSNKGTFLHFYSEYSQLIISEFHPALRITQLAERSELLSSWASDQINHWSAQGS